MGVRNVTMYSYKEFIYLFLKDIIIVLIQDDIFINYPTVRF